MILCSLRRIRLSASGLWNFLSSGIFFMCSYIESRQACSISFRSMSSTNQDKFPHPLQPVLLRFAPHLCWDNTLYVSVMRCFNECDENKRPHLSPKIKRSQNGKFLFCPSKQSSAEATQTGILNKVCLEEARCINCFSVSQDMRVFTDAEYY